MSLDARLLARELLDGYAHATPIGAPPSSRDAAFDLTAAYRVENEVARLRREAGHAAAGWKVGFANKAMWRILKLETLVWARMYDDTVHDAANNHAALSLENRLAPKLEPEIVFKLGRRVEPGLTDAAAVLASVEWMAVGFEINDCLFPDWQFTPPDFVAALGFHTALVIGAPSPVTPDRIDALTEQLAQFKVKLLRNGECVEEGSGRNSLRSPALCLAELASAMARRPDASSSGLGLAPGDLVSTGTLTSPQPVEAGQAWRAELHGLALPPLDLKFS